MNAIGTLQMNGSRQIMRMVKPGPDDETTSSMPNEPEQTSVKTTTTTVNSRMRTRLSAGSVKKLPTSDMRTPQLHFRSGRRERKRPSAPGSQSQTVAGGRRVRPGCGAVRRSEWTKGQGGAWGQERRQAGAPP